MLKKILLSSAIFLSFTSSSFANTTSLNQLEHLQCEIEIIKFNRIEALGEVDLLKQYRGRSKNTYSYQTSVYFLRSRLESEIDGVRQVCRGEENMQTAAYQMYLKGEQKRDRVNSWIKDYP